MKTAHPKQHSPQSKIVAQQNRKTQVVSLTLPEAHSDEQFKLINGFEVYGCRFIVGACGTKFGKTYACTIRLTKEAWDNKGSLNWWVAPSYAQSKMAYNMVKRLLPVGTYLEYKADLRLVLIEPDGSEHSTIEFKSGDNPDGLRGFGVNFVVIDEAARVPYESFVSVMTTLTQTRGRAIIISTPKGRGWFYDVYMRGEKQGLLPGEIDQWKEWFSVRLPTWVNPTVPTQSIEEMRRNLPEDVFRQEVAAQFLLESAGVFRNIRGCMTTWNGQHQPALPGRRYIMGVDLARINDYTVLTVVDTVTKHVVYLDRFNQLSWQVQYFRIMEVAKAYNNALIIQDTTGIGDPIFDALINAGLRVSGYKIGSNVAKQQLIEKLRIQIERGDISFPAIPVLINELERYEYIVSDNGTIKYSAPSGHHDDCVISLALAVMGLDVPPWVYHAKNVRGI